MSDPDDREWMDAALGPVKRAESPSAEAREYAALFLAVGMSLDTREAPSPGYEHMDERRRGLEIGRLARAVEAFADHRVRAAIETACAAVCWLCKDGHPLTNSDGYAGTHRHPAEKRTVRCYAARIRTAFPAPASAAAEREEGG